MRTRSIVILLCSVAMVFGIGFTAFGGAIEYSVEQVTEFSIPAGNVVHNPDLSKGYDGWLQAAGSSWDTIIVSDSNNYLTGGKSLFVHDKSGFYGRWVQDMKVDPTKKYRLGWIFKMEDYKGSIGVGFYMMDIFGFVELNKKVEIVGSEFLGDLKVSGWAAYLTTYMKDEEVIPFTGTMEWTKVEIILDLPELAKILKTGPGGITQIRGDLITTSLGTGKFWLDCMYLVPVD